MKKYLLLSFALLLTVACIGFATLQPQTVAEVSGQATYNDSKITVTGTGKVKVKPDFATISLSIETKSRDVEEAQSENAKIVRELVEVLEKNGVVEDDIKADWFNIFPDYDYYGNRPIGHRVNNQISIKVRDTSNAGKIIDLATASGATNISGVQFGIEENSGAYGEALTKAVESAKQKAARLSGVSGLGALQIVSIKEITNGQYGFHPYHYARATADSVGGGSTPIMHDDIEVTATVEIKFVSSPIGSDNFVQFANPDLNRSSLVQRT